ncbi:biotin--[acetyl-CoA-carboxylase] ligase [Sphingomonas sp. Leaf25]|uniref:biotin--[acetyl-CoA-carboxylase] ligase n=1 Tax=Sphingomonas sp. Leaf25 TaxID=1735692 RepID=UPI000A58976C|nr:biotin--[acetyl-CoA-carboxylase] ligase [Sphingomonas sp. Leaf25]
MDDDGGAGTVLSVRTVAETGSTNADLLAASTEGAPEGAWLRAERQTAGRGRMGRTWADATGNLFASTIVRLRLDDPVAPSLALVAAVALHAAIDSVLPGRAAIKWPNDLMIDGAKLSGILLERSGEAVVVGFGVNLAMAPVVPGRRTICLADQGVRMAPDDMLDRLRASFAHWLAEWRRAGANGICDAWMRAAHPVGASLRVSLPDGTRTEGTFAGLDPSGALLLAQGGGAVRTIHAGDVDA